MSDYYPNDLDIGTTVHLTATLSASGVPVNGTVTLTATSPTGSAHSVVVYNDGTGQYHGDVVVDEAGTWTYSWVSGNPVSVKNGFFVVRGTPAPATTQIITAQDVAINVNQEFDVDTTNYVNYVIGILQEALEMRLNRQLSIRSVTEEHLLPRDMASKLYLFQTPVVSVESVAVSSSNSNLADYSTYLLDPSGYLWTDFGELSLTAYLELDFDWYAIGEAQVFVTYTAGVNGLNYPGLKNLLLGAASREYLTRQRGVQGISSISVEGSSWSFGKQGFFSGGKGGGGGVPTFTEDELLGISRLKKRVVAF